MSNHWIEFIIALIVISPLWLYIASRMFAAGLVSGIIQGYLMSAKTLTDYLNKLTDQINKQKDRNLN